MNHHLRFPVSSAVLLAGVLLSSCSSTPPPAKIPPLVASPGHDVTYEVRIFDLPADQPFQGPASEVLSREEGERLMALQKGEASFAKSTAGRFGQKRILTNLREFLYPSKWTPPRRSTGESGGFPVLPATPSAISTTQLGSTVELVGSETRPGWTNVNVKINRKVLLGFQNYGKPIMTEGTNFWGKSVPIMITENRIDKPVFSSQTMKADEELSTGQYLVIRGKGTRAPADSKPPVDAIQGSQSPDFIAFIRVATRS